MSALDSRTDATVGSHRAHLAFVPLQSTIYVSAKCIGQPGGRGVVTFKHSGKYHFLGKDPSGPCEEWRDLVKTLAGITQEANASTSANAQRRFDDFQNKTLQVIARVPSSSTIDIVHRFDHELNHCSETHGWKDIPDEWFDPSQFDSRISRNRFRRLRNLLRSD